MSLEAVFPSAPRVDYRKPVLSLVVCQFRFPTIFKIETSPPADFQEAIRTYFPIAERQTRNVLDQFGANLQLPPEVANFMVGASSAPRYQFFSEDRATSIALTTDFLTIQTSTYPGWPIFSTLIAQAFDAFVALYKPSFFTRVGLRYVNNIELDRLGLSECKWSELLNPQLIGPVSSDIIADGLMETRGLLRFKDQPDSFLLQHGTLVAPNDNRLYTVDFDFYAEPKIECGDGKNAANRLNHYAGRAFRWAISDKLHAALEPQSV